MEIEKNFVFDTYDKIAHHFNDTRHYKWKWISDFVEELNYKDKNKNVLDLGCGNGRNMEYDGLNFIGVDTCEEFVNICLSKNLNCILSDMCSLPFKKDSFDAILCIESFHHLASRERRINSLLEMHRILKPSGKILLSVWSKNQPKKTKRVFNEYGDNIVKWNKDGKIYDRFYYIFKKDELEELFLSCNFKIDSHVWDCGNEVYTLIK